MKNKVGYYHKRLDTGETFYVGIGTPERPYENKHRNNYWNHIVKKVEYEVIIVKENLSWEDACDWEKSEIEKIGRKDLGLGPLVNMTDGGEGTQGVIITEERRINISLAVKKAMLNPEVIQKMKNAKVNFKPWNNGMKGWNSGKHNFNYGNHWSDEKKNELSEKLKETYKDGFSNEHIVKLKEKRKGKKPALGMKHTKEQKNKWSEDRQGQNHPQSKLNEESVLWIRSNYDPSNITLTIKSLSKKFLVSEGAIKNIIYKRTWKHLL